jgi:hypothetical protein
MKLQEQLKPQLLMALAALGITANPILMSGAHADSVGRVTVMEVDQVRDAASISRAKALYRSQTGGKENSGSGTFSSGCSDLNIGNVDTSVGQRGPRNVTVVIEGPVIQENNCR